MVRRHRGGASFEFGEHLAQAGEIVPHNLVKSVRSQNIVEITEHVADIQIPFLHRLTETEIFDRNMFEVGFQFQVSRHSSARLRPNMVAASRELREAVRMRTQVATQATSQQL